MAYQKINAVLLLLANLLDDSLKVLLLGDIANDWDDFAGHLGRVVLLGRLLQDILTAGSDVDTSAVGSECLGGPGVSLARVQIK